MVEAIIYRYRCGLAWRDLPEVFGPWQTVWTWHRRMAAVSWRARSRGEPPCAASVTQFPAAPSTPGS